MNQRMVVIFELFSRMHQVNEREWRSYSNYYYMVLTQTYIYIISTFEIMVLLSDALKVRI